MVVLAVYLILLRGGVRCNLFVLRDREEGVMTVWLVGCISDAKGELSGNDYVQMSTTLSDRENGLVYGLWIVNCGLWRVGGDKGGEGDNERFVTMARFDGEMRLQQAKTKL